MNPKAEWAARAAINLEAVRFARPLVHNITNFVVMNFTANVLLAAGASPVMAHAENEVEEMVSLARALVLNIGTLEDAWIAAMVKAGTRAMQLGVPIILDPVGAGATRLRTAAARRILTETQVALVRGNASEILALGGGEAKTRGVDSADSVEAAAERANALARELSVPVAITGTLDFITDGCRTLRVANGHAMMGGVTGTGCGATAIIGAFAAVDPDPVSAAATALAYYGLAGEQAAAGATGPGSFLIRFLDALHALTPAELERGARIQEN
ncbi:MAG: hydroxyethylthiazole kinase [Kiritimatiellae bacterium]|jgi:hydroxyethylthiazole kinase|nr:hydroxyethylthiazole kinase [Kiritimatiellia bacterium]NLD90333.1 hydroxyethylthiazole kinase [Lentisphaerota bacterium]HPC19885.1 hydroxyethylthiazole kinase [Kiritimatiellia bacterium]HQN80624.1 hydroxyethylthiazole kinase [Kiritimatiellia bacterium]